MPHVLVVDDDPNTREALADIVADEGLSVASAASVRDARSQICLQPPDVLLVDLNLPDGSGMDLFEDMEVSRNADIVLITGDASVESAVKALRLGAADYLTKPVSFKRLKSVLSRLACTADLAPDPEMQRDSCNGRFGRVLGTAPVMQKLYDHVARVAPTEATVLLLGESGTGKELAAQTIHEMSLRHKQPFLPVNCGAISPQLIESEIFGHEKGSFTGADRQHKGYFERASGGTLFLDEITEMPLELQVKLLRVLENGAFMRIGSNTELETNVRVIAATNRDPEEAVAEGKLRLDLYHRLNVFPIRIPPLRERGDDIAMLARHFLEELNRHHASGKILLPETLTTLMAYHWPGNVRELRNCIHRAYILSDQMLEIELAAPAASPLPASSEPSLAIPVGTSLAEIDRKFIFATLELCGGVKKRAADILGISLKTLYNRLEEYGSMSGVVSRHEASKPMPGKSSSSGSAPIAG